MPQAALSLAQGLLVTVELTLAAAALAVVAAIAAGLGRSARSAAIRAPVRIYVEVFRGTSALVQLFWFYFALPLVGVDLGAMTAGILVLGLNTRAYRSEIVRGAIRAVPPGQWDAGLEGIPRGQWEAAAALDLSSLQTLRHVIVPQAIPPVVPALGNRFIALFKDTPMLSAITVLELLQRAKIIGAESFRYLEPITLVGLLFLLLSLVSAWGVQRLEARLQLRH